MNSQVKDLRRRIEDLGDDMIAQYGQQPFCEILHRELGLDETPRPDLDEQKAKASRMIEQMGVPVDMDEIAPEGHIRLTVEHAELHQMLTRVLAQVTAEGGGPEQAMALMLSAGRRMGMQEAASLLGEGA